MTSKAEMRRQAELLVSVGGAGGEGVRVGQSGQRCRGTCGAGAACLHLAAPVPAPVVVALPPHLLCLAPCRRKSKR